jgi:hypothetical protein
MMTGWNGCAKSAAKWPRNLTTIRAKPPPIIRRCSSATPTAPAQGDILAAIQRHHDGDWVDMPEENGQENELSAQQGFRLLSAYSSAQGGKFWIITDGDTSVTTLLLPEGY